MGKIIKSDLVIGNFIINNIMYNKYEFKIPDILKYYDELFPELAKLNYFAQFSINDIEDFQKRYSWFFDNNGNIKNNINMKELINYFQKGVPIDIVQKFQIPLS